jgi:hypothetical protein
VTIEFRNRFLKPDSSSQSKPQEKAQSGSSEERVQATRQVIPKKSPGGP